MTLPCNILLHCGFLLRTSKDEKSGKKQIFLHFTFAHDSLVAVTFFVVPSAVTECLSIYVILPSISSCTEISEGSFSQCKQLKIIEFEKDSILNSIGKNAFTGTSIEKVTIPSKVTSIGEAAFFNFERLKTVEFEKDSNLNSIGKNAFSETPIEKVTIPSSCTEISESSFSQCKQLKIVEFEKDSILNSNGTSAIREVN